MKSDFQIEFCDDGQWRDALIATVLDPNNVSLWWIDAGGSWHMAKASRGAESGNFRNRG